MCSHLLDIIRCALKRNFNFYAGYHTTYKVLCGAPNHGTDDLFVCYITGGSLIEIHISFF